MAIFETASAKTFALLELLAVSDTEYSSAGSDLPEPDTTLDPANWAAGTAYAVLDQVRYEHYIYSRIIAGTTATAPSSDTTNWALVSYTNRWKLFDAANTTQTYAPAGASVNFAYQITFAAGKAFDTIVFDNVEGVSTIRVRTYDRTSPPTLLSSETVTLREYDSARTWARRKSAAFLSLLNDAGGTVIDVTITKYGSEVPKIGSMSIGNKRDLGVPVSGFGVGIVDRSLKIEDDFGNFYITERGYSKRASGVFALPSASVDGVVELLARHRATHAVYMVVGSDYLSMCMLGFFKNFEVTVQGPDLSYCSIDIEGLTS